MKNKTLLLDIDYTIHNNAKFKLLLSKDLKKQFDLPTKKLFSIYDQVLFENGYFNPKDFIKKISKELNNKHKIEIANILWDRKKFNKSIYKDSYNFIKKAKLLTKIWIFSKGDKDFQLSKLNPLEKDNKFNSIYIFKDKLKNIGNLINKLKENTIFVIDDSPLVINTFKEKNKNIITILIKRKNGKTHIFNKKIQANYKVKNLISAVKIIKSY